MSFVLGIESSCDETGIGCVEYHLGHQPMLRAHALHTQASVHRPYGGVVPELASRDHIRRVVPLVQRVLGEVGCSLGDIDTIACTQGPGLAGALLVGSGFAAALGWALGRPVMPIHHLEGHLLSPFLSPSPPSFPFIALLVSGGHTQLMLVEAVGCYKTLGETIDDAAGEAFDKVAKLLGLGYPGGPLLAALAAQGRSDAFALPRPLLHRATLDFSFAGLKTAVLTQITRLGVMSEATRADLAASVQEAIVDVLSIKTMHALGQTGVRSLVVAGGVGANRVLRARLQHACAQAAISFHCPAIDFCTDNGAMIAMAAAMRLQSGLGPNAEDASGPRGLQVRPRWDLEAIAPC